VILKRSDKKRAGYPARFYGEELKGQVALRPSLHREQGQIGKTQKPPSMARSAHAITHLIPEVRPYRANALRCSKTLPAFLSMAWDAFLF